MPEAQEPAERERVVVDSTSIDDQQTYELDQAMRDLFPDFELLVARSFFPHDRVTVSSLQGDRDIDLRTENSRDSNLRRDCFQAVAGRDDLPSGNERSWTDDDRQASQSVQILEAHHEILPPRRLVRSDDGRTTWPEVGIDNPVVIHRGILVTNRRAIVQKRDYLERRLATKILSYDEFLDIYLPPGSTPIGQPSDEDPVL